VLGFQVIRFGVERGWSTAGGVAVAAAVSLGVATLLHYLVEIPGERWSRLAFKGPTVVPPRGGSRVGGSQPVDRLDLVD
jgi:peptidoglycan/LPS O-acetylase OafA/YrhL